MYVLVVSITLTLGVRAPIAMGTRKPGIVAAVLENPNNSEAYLGAMSTWFNRKPPPYWKPMDAMPMVRMTIARAGFLQSMNVSSTQLKAGMSWPGMAKHNERSKTITMWVIWRQEHTVWKIMLDGLCVLWMVSVLPMEVKSFLVCVVFRIFLERR